MVVGGDHPCFPAVVAITGLAQAARERRPLLSRRPTSPHATPPCPQASPSSTSQRRPPAAAAPSASAASLGCVCAGRAVLLCGGVYPCDDGAAARARSARFLCFPGCAVQVDPQTLSVGLACGTAFNITLIVANAVGNSSAATYSGNPVTTAACSSPPSPPPSPPSPPSPPLAAVSPPPPSIVSLPPP